VTSIGTIYKAVWRWDSDPFGTSLDNSKPTENPQIITGTQTVQQAGTFKQNVRFPGQLADGESAKYYNYFRDYDSSIGRYSTSDPIGLAGGINSFAYVKNQPGHFTDPLGLFEPSDGGGGIDGSGRCGLVADISLGWRVISPLPPVNTRLCVYKCGPPNTCGPAEQYFSRIVERWYPPYKCPRWMAP
ncbi:MAG: RHS repeat-associated core domain-containing protein, partial [Betaproteobacteria bacterium]